MLSFGRKDSTELLIYAESFYSHPFNTDVTPFCSVLNNYGEVGMKTSPIE